MEVQKFGPGVTVSEEWITETYKDGLPEAEGMLRMAREKGDKVLAAFMQSVVDDMKQWIEDHLEEGDESKIHRCQ